jgi:multidrug efflux system outer membrane protein
VPSIIPNPQNSYQVLASASWEIDLWGRIRRLSESAQAELFATEEAWHGAVKALYYPTISLTGAFGYASSDLSNLFQGSARVWSYAGSFTGPIFTGGAITSQVKQAEAARNAALFSYELTIQSAFADAETSLVSRSKLADQVQAQERLVRANSEYVRLARLQYDGGYAPYSTVLQAEQQLFPSELNPVQSRASLFNSLVNIYKAMGGGWQIASERKPDLFSRW